jgi:hypothetical protein
MACLLAIGHVESLARSPLGDFGRGPLAFGAPERNGRATGDPARPGGRPGRRPLVPLARPEKFLRQANAPPQTIAVQSFRLNGLLVFGYQRYGIFARFKAGEHK